MTFDSERPLDYPPIRNYFKRGKKTPSLFWVLGVVLSLVLAGGIVWSLDTPSESAVVSSSSGSSNRSGENLSLIVSGAGAVGELPVMPEAPPSKAEAVEEALTPAVLPVAPAPPAPTVTPSPMPRALAEGSSSSAGSSGVTYTGLAMIEQGPTGWERNPNAVPRYNIPNQNGAPDWTAMTAEIERLIAECTGTVGLVIEDLNGSYSFRHNARVRMASASLVKLPIMAAVFDEIERGQYRLTETLPLLESQRESGSGVLKRVRAGEQIPIHDLIYLMITASDNTATTMLSDRLGYGAVNGMCSRLGMTQTDMVRDIMDLDLRPRGIENWTTAEDMARFFRLLYQRQIVSPAASEQMMGILLDQHLRDRLPKYLPWSVPVAHKTGLIRGVAHDCGIVFLPGHPIIVSSLTRDFDCYTTGKLFSAHVARVLYDGIVTGASLPQESR